MHAHDNVFFARHENGDVEVSKRPQGEGTRADWICVIPVAAWPGVVEAMNPKPIAKPPPIPAHAHEPHKPAHKKH